MSASTTSQATYVERAITVIIQLGTGTFGQTGSNTVTLAGLRCSATIEKQSPPSFGNAEVRIYGVRPDVMNQVSTLGIPYAALAGRRNFVTIQAGNAGQPLAQVWKGYIQNAWQDLSDQETFLQIVSHAGVVDAMAPVPPLSFPTPFDVATALSGVANVMGRSFVNYGVTTQLPPGYYPGTAMDQAHAIAKKAGIELDPGGAPGDEFAIWTKTGYRGTLNGSKPGSATPLVSASAGMIGYPKFQSNAIGVKTLYNPSITRGGLISVQSTLFPPSSGQASAIGANGQGGTSNGLWYVISPLVADLSAQIPGGPWDLDISATSWVAP